MIYILSHLKTINRPVLWFFYKTIKKKFSLSLFYTQPHSDIYREKDLLYKFCKIQKLPRDVIRKYVYSQAKREYSGAVYLNSIGIKTPKPVNYAVSLNPFSKTESLYIMEYLKDTVQSDTVLNNSVLNLIINDLQKMVDNNIYFKDLRFHNILYSPKTDEIFWIDTDIKIIKNRKKYIDMLKKALKRMTKKHPETYEKLISALKL